MVSPRSLDEIVYDKNSTGDVPQKLFLFHSNTNNIFGAIFRSFDFEPSTRNRILSYNMQKLKGKTILSKGKLIAE